MEKCSTVFRFPMLNIQDIDCPAYFLVIEVPWQEVIEVPWQEVNCLQILNAKHSGHWLPSLLFGHWGTLTRGVNSCLYILIVKPIKVSSFEPELNQRPKDVNICNLQSSALPTELSKGRFMFNSVAFFWKMSISWLENVQQCWESLC